MYCLLELFSGLPSFLASALSHEHGDARGNLTLSRSHTGVFGCHLVYVFLNSRATCLAASSGPSDDRRMRCGGGEEGKGEGRGTLHSTGQSRCGRMDGEVAPGIPKHN